MPRRLPADAGFTLIETLISVSVIAVVMGALTTFFVNTLSVGTRQGTRQTAIQLAGDGIDRARALRGASVLNDRDAGTSDIQWASPVKGVDPSNKGMTLAWDMAKASDGDASYGTGATATLPTTPLATVVGGVEYQTSWYVGRCWQPLDGGVCGRANIPGYVPFFRVVVAVTWADHNCTTGICSYVNATLISSAGTEPEFISIPGAQPPRVKQPGPQDGVEGDTVSVTVRSSGGVAPLIWSATGLPQGLTMDSSGKITGTLARAGTYTATVTVTDDTRATNSATVTWTVVKPLAVTAPAAQASTRGAAISALTLAATGGKAPYTWSATGLPAGLTLDAAAGQVTGTPATAGSYVVTVTATDDAAATDAKTFTWTVQ